MNENILIYIKSLSDNKKVQEILIKTIGNILLKQDNFNEIISENFDKIIHIRDWISSVIENNEEWNIPRVLTIVALNNSADKYFEKKNNKLKIIELDEKHEELIADLDNYYIVQMLTPEALDNESKIMQHCIGQGNYDEKLKNQNYQYLSLRDKYNKAHVTIEIYKNRILQLQGKQNKLPETKYLEILLPWLMESNYENIPWKNIGKYFNNKQWINFEDIEVKENIDYTLNRTFDDCYIINCLNEKAIIYFYIMKKCNKVNYILSDKNKNIIFTQMYFCKNEKEILQYLIDNNYKDIKFVSSKYVLNKNDNKIYFKNELPDNCKIDGDLILVNSEELKKLPNNLIVNGNLAIVRCENFKELPDGLVINKSLILSDINIIKLSDDIQLRDSLELCYSNIETLPDNFIINGNLNLYGCQKFKKLPKGLVVNEYLNLSHTNITEIPEDIKIGGCLNLEFLIINKIPDNLSCNIIYIDQNQIYLIKETMDFNEIKVNSRNFTKKEFFEKYEKKDNLLFY